MTPALKHAVAETVVATDPMTAFRIFTEQIDQWWVPGPINYFHADRSPHMQIEAHLGGRVLEVYATEVLVISEIIRFDPGHRLDLRGVVDNSMTEITFETQDRGTLVRVTAYQRDGGADAFLFWPNVIEWLTRHVASINRSTTGELS